VYLCGVLNPLQEAIMAYIGLTDGQDIARIQGSPAPRRPPVSLGWGGVPTEAQATAAGANALEIVKDAADGSWDTFVGLVATAGYINIGPNGSQEGHLLIPTLRKNAFPS